MLSPVSIVSTNSTNLAQRETPTSLPTTIAPATIADAAVALSLAANSEVEGKLNMLLIGARERMLDSLFAVVDAVSKSLSMQPEPAETNVAYALRLAGTLADLNPKQAAAVQQQLNMLGPAASLALVARALQNPVGTEAAQVVAYMEVVRYKEKDLATKAVVASYGQNGADEAQSASRRAPVVQSGLAGSQQEAVPARLPVAGQPVTQAAAPPAPVAEEGLSVPTPSTAPMPQSTTTTEVPVLPPIADAAGANGSISKPAAGQSQEPDHPPVAPGTQATEPPGQIVQTGRQNAVTSAPPAPPEQPQGQATPSQPAPARLEPAIVDKSTLAIAVPRDEISAASSLPGIPAGDAQTALKVVVAQLISATGVDLMQTMAEIDPVVEKVVAQALVADMIDSAEVGALPSPEDDMPPARLNTGSAMASSMRPSLGNESATEELASLTALNRLLAQSAPVAPNAQQVLPLQAQLPLGIPFAVGQYLPLDDAPEQGDGLYVDRVDAVEEDEEGGSAGGQGRDAEENENEQQLEAGDPADWEATDELDAEAAPSASVSLKGGSRPLALPRPSPIEPFREPAVNLYQRMGGWD